MPSRSHRWWWGSTIGRSGSIADSVRRASHSLFQTYMRRTVAAPLRSFDVIRRAAIGDEDTLRVLRLQAMVDAPDQFGSTYEREAARSTDDWQRWFAPGATFIFENSSGPVALAAGVWADSEPSGVYLMAGWGHPKAPGTAPGGEP